MTLTLAQAVGQKLMLSFIGSEPPPAVLALLKEQHIAGFTLFRHHNAQNPAQVRALTTALQQAAREAGQPPLLIGIDQEGGTLLALPGATRFPGNLALGATRSAELARRAGLALGKELAALGINVDYAPVCDVNVNPKNPVVGPRSFGEDPALVGRLAAAMIDGLQTAGVAATAKHFPGHGDTAIDSHQSAPSLPHAEDRLRRVELPPFAAAMQAGVKLMMTGHLSLPNFEGLDDLPATLSPKILRGLLRGELGYTGVIITDAMDMHAIHQGPGLMIDSVTAVNAGCDLLLLSAEQNNDRSVYSALLQAAERRLLDQADVLASAERVLGLKDWCSAVTVPALDVVGCADHQALAEEIANHSITLVRDTTHQLPLQPSSDSRVAVIVPQPADLTPADTSSYEKPALAEAIRAYHPHVDEFLIPLDPSETDIAALRVKANDYDHILIGTLNATNYAGQAALVHALLEQNPHTIVAALRMPYDLQVFPNAPTYLCAYSLQPASLQALAKGLFGQMPFVGTLPVSIEGLEP